MVLAVPLDLRRAVRPALGCSVSVPGAPVGMSSATGRPGSWIIHMPGAVVADLVGGRVGGRYEFCHWAAGSWILHVPGAVLADLVFARIGAVMSSATRRPPRGLSARRLPGGRSQPHPGNRAPIRGSELGAQGVRILRGSRTGCSGGQDPQGSRTGCSGIRAGSPRSRAPAGSLTAAAVRTPWRAGGPGSRSSDGRYRCRGPDSAGGGSC